ncbi:protein of unknown function DUF125 transmembrane [Desulfurobacterium thermolithotrophum DSM 11699]|uniref:Rubrerythrin diiron-binding domain-containing protein n=1 Tax=Desulfurobacterium thermolithotrophum (strain DSM 11699 / BSA) TaxID=868864 RepID=F0S1M3_DESTD|nr:VIT1/CCC1 transporter family protein [Desulfurobacterium thermolithotrophum]ADY74026.1 protein of unknown function DUF125 transmembrane [Desulfurobacterium thermolithotrophum DSM 11699]
MDTKRVKEFYLGELSDSFLYEKLAKKEKDARRKEELLRISQIEKVHADFRKSVLEKRGIEPPDFKLSGKVSLLLKITSLIPPALIVSLFEFYESSTVREYYKFLKSSELSEEEKEQLKKIIVDEIEHESFFRSVVKEFDPSRVRDLVFGMNDGLVEILGAVSGFSAVYPDRPEIVGLSGLIVGFAGAASMGIGAFISSKSQKEVSLRNREELEILKEVSPDTLIERVSQELGIEKENLKKLPRKVLIRLLLEEENSGEEIKFGVVTGLAYLLGVIFPVFPYFLLENSYGALALSILSAGIVLAITGSFVAFLSGISIKKKAIEMLMVGFAAAGFSYFIGRIANLLFGIEIS